jgi:hypothetical protein
MLITDRFIHIHQPKTGGTFVAKTLLRLYQVPRNPQASRHDVAFETPYGPFIYCTPKHNRCINIPAPHRSKKVLATVRNPYDSYVSHYEFGWWKDDKYREHYDRTPDFDRRYPGFPNLGFPEFVDFFNRVWFIPGSPRAHTTESVGRLTRDFILYFFKDPRAVFSRLDESYFASGAYRSDMFDVHFLRTDRLNRELHDFLLREGFRPEDIAFILGLGKILPEGSRRDAQRTWDTYYTPEVKALVRSKERYLFTLFPAFDV